MNTLNTKSGIYVKGNKMITTKAEALALENELDALVSKALNEDATVSMALTGRIKINFNGNYISFESDFETVNYLNYHGYLENLNYTINIIRAVFASNKEKFETLLDSYNNRSKLI